MVRGKKYGLTCFFDTLKRKHVMLNCLRENNIWYQYNDVKGAVTILKEQDECKPFVLMYKKIR